jgi:hypothetical protein
MPRAGDLFTAGFFPVGLFFVGFFFVGLLFFGVVGVVGVLDLVGRFLFGLFGMVFLPDRHGPPGCIRSRSAMVDRSPRERVRGVTSPCMMNTRRA